jgi:hypothetical protein
MGDRVEAVDLGEQLTSELAALRKRYGFRDAILVATMPSENQQVVLTVAASSSQPITPEEVSHWLTVGSESASEETLEGRYGYPEGSA